jgi:hypothetical protein
MSRFTVELVPNTLVRKSTISNDETGSGSVFGFAIINGLDIDCPVGKSLGMDAGDHINSWCGVHLDIYDSAKALDRHDLADTRAKLFHHVDGHGVAMDDYPGGGLSLFLSLSVIEYENIISLTHNPKSRIVVECDAWFERADEDKTIFAKDAGNWCARFETIGLTFGGIDRERWPLAGLIGRKHDEFEKAIPGEQRKNRFDFSRYLSKSVGRWAMGSPVSRNSVIAEIDEAFEIAKNIMDWSAPNAGAEIDRYVKKTWSTCSYFEMKLMEALVGEHVDELLREIQSARNTAEVTAIKSYYRVVDIPEVSKYAALTDLSIGIALGITVGIGVGWAVGILAGFVSLSILDIKARIHRNEFRKSSSNLTSLIRDLEHTKSICRRPDARTVCPRYIRERLEEMESRGVGWYEGTLDIVRHAEARNENLWV